MQTIKYIILFFIFLLSNIIGKTISQKYRFRQEELEDMQNALNIFKTKIKFTYTPLGEIFEEISNNANKQSTKRIFLKAKENLEDNSASKAWEKALDEINTNMDNEDINTLKNLSKLLGESDIEGQISQIEITEQFLEPQIKKAQKEREKNEKLYQKLGTIVGLGIVVILC